MSLEALQNENKLCKEHLENINAEKVALDQLYVESLKSNLLSKKELILLTIKFKKLESENESIKKELEDVKKEKAYYEEMIKKVDNICI